MARTKIEFNTGTCTQDHYGEVPDQISQLPESQAGKWRHRCAACAYKLGFEEGLKAAARPSSSRRTRVSLSLGRTGFRKMLSNR